MTSLQKQLAVIAASSTHQLDLKAQKLAHGKSLLFEPRQAANQSFENIYLICYEGYRDLCALDPRFVQFSRSLFSEQSKVEDRTQMTKAENAKLDEVLQAFICMVGPRLLLKPAEKALEWLVRRFRVHEYNTECLILTYLPYHNTPQFLALLSILPPNPPLTLRFLHPYIQSPTNPPRQTIVYTAINTPAFFNALQNYATKVLEGGHQSSTLLSFWSSITAQAIDGILDQGSSGRREIQDQRTEGLLLRVLPVLNACMKSAYGAEAVIACYMIIIGLVTKTSFQDKVLDSLMEAAILSSDSTTLEECLTCLAVIAEERSKVALSPTVVKRLLRISDLTQRLMTVSKKCLANRLTLGYALGALERTGQSEEALDAFQSILESNLLDEPRLSVALSSFLQLLSSRKRGSMGHGLLIDYALKLNETRNVSKVLREVAKKDGTDLEALGLTLGQSIYAVEADAQASEDEEMLDADGLEESGAPAAQPPNILETTFLDPKASESFLEVLPRFEQAVASDEATRFLKADSLQQPDAFQTPLFLSFLIRSWCSSASATARAAALRRATSLIQKTDISVDLQNMIPYLLYALADPSAITRRSAAACTIALSRKMSATKNKAHTGIWASSGLYGKESSKISPLHKDQTQALLSVLVPMLEESTMDSNYVITAVREILEGTQSPKNAKNGLKSSLRSPILSFLGCHVAVTPLLTVRLRLLSLFNFLGRASAGIRTGTILPIVRKWCSMPASEVAAQCEIEKIDATEVDRIHLTTLMPREAESVSLLKDIITGKCSKDRKQLVGLAFDRLSAIWSKLRSDSRLTLSEQLLELSLAEIKTDFDELCRGRALDTLRHVKLDTATLVAFLDSVPSSVQMPEGPPAKKRRRTSRSEMARVELQSPEEVSRLLSRLTLVLELIEGSKPAEHPVLFKNLFAVLGELQQLKQQSGSELVYLQSLILSSLAPIVDRIKDEKDTSEYQASIRADLLIDCIRHSTSPQVQTAALLLITLLASWVPELVLPNLMPVFTFVGSTVLRQQDDYSAHVVDQTISRVIPPLAASLRAKYKNFLTGVADLLLSFTAAFEHIPPHRRLKIFSELARTLGPVDSLSVIIALLVDRYSNSKTQSRFSTDLLLAFDPIVALETFKSYLALVADASGDGRKISDTLFSLNEKQPNEVENALNSLLSAIADLSTDERLRTHVSRAFRKKAEPERPRTVFAAIIETVIQISKEVVERPKVYQSCSRVLGNCLDLLPTADLIKSVELLLSSPDRDVQIAAIKSVEVRAGTVTQNDQESVTALLAFLHTLDEVLQRSQQMDVKRVTLSCIDSIIGRFGKRDTTTVSEVARTISGPQSLASSDDRARILSLLCLTSIVDVLDDEAISLLPTVLPIVFEYLGTAIDQENTGLHNAVYTLISNIVLRVGFMFSRDYLVPILKLSQRSAVGDLDEACDEERHQFYERVSQHLGAQEVFTAIKSTWSDATGRGFEACQEQLDLMRSTIGSQTKPKLIKASSTLFPLLLDIFGLRSAITSSGEEDFDDDEVGQLEGTLIEAVIAMTLKLSDATFRPFFVQLVDKASSKLDISRSITFYKFLAVFFDKFKSIVTSYSSYVIEDASSLLESLAKQGGNTALREAVLAALQKTFQHDQDGFWQAPSHFGAIMTPLLAQLTIDSSEEITADIIPAITELAAASSSSTDNHREMNTVLLNYMRAEEAHTRLATVKCEQSLTKRLGEEWLGLLPEMLPFISELREDDDEMVERETQRWISMVEEILGEDLDAMLQ